MNPFHATEHGSGEAVTLTEREVEQWENGNGYLGESLCRSWF
jgi:hypothetical protein